uniref:tRNA/rRNA methyltransferase SpoU type domain-containing protein n=1 Tax=Chaetoceros debilis TaxID=122233 RepID=A0A7S3PUN3_9STRA
MNSSIRSVSYLLIRSSATEFAIIFMFPDMKGVLIVFILGGPLLFKISSAFINVPINDLANRKFGPLNCQRRFCNKSIRFHSKIQRRNDESFRLALKTEGDSGSEKPIVEEPYRSKSTHSPDSSSQFHAGSEERKERLHRELKELGVDLSFLELPEYQGSAALRTYSSFILPKSKGALAMTEQPRRAAVVANSIAFLIREHQTNQKEWMRNHDRALEEIESSSDTSERNPIILLLDNVRSAHNVGNILRAAEAAKCTSVMLCGSMTPSPPHPKVLKTALGAAEYVPFLKAPSTLKAIQELKQQKVKVIGVETTSRSIPLWKCSFFDSLSAETGDEAVGNDDGRGIHQQVAFVFGNEMIGVDTQCLDECDELIILPTHGVKNSLNVATCASVVIWEALRQLDAYRDTEGDCS